MSSSNGFDFPTIELAKTKAEEGSAAWLKAQVAEHGDTDALKLEARRARLSRLATLSERGLRNSQTEKKVMHSRYAKAISDARKALAEAPSGAKPGIAQHIQTMEAEAGESLLQYEQLIEGKALGLATLEALCLLIDSTTLREEAEHIATKKKGLVRTSMAALIDENLTMVNMVYRRTKKLHDAFLKANMLPLDESSDEDMDDQLTVSENEIVTPEERKKIDEEDEY